MSSPATARDEDAPLIELRGVHKGFGGAPLLRGVDLTIRRGRTTVLMGESGSGKSVLIKLMSGLLLPDAGSVLLFGRDTRAVSRRELNELRGRIGTMFQNYALFDSMTVFENVAFPLVEGRRMGKREIAAKVNALLGELNLSDAGGLFPGALSGGMKKRVSLARALVSQPECVLFDEPTTGLDPVMIERVDEMLVDARERFGVTMAVVSHDMASAFKLADDMAMIHGGRISWHGTPEETRRCGQPEVARFIEQATSRLEYRGDSGGEAPVGAGRTSGEEAPAGPALAAEIGAIGDEIWAMGAEAPVVRVTEVTKRFGERPVLQGVSFSVPPRRITTLIGGSGSGKTVMMKHVLGLFQPTSGRVEVFGRDLAKASESELLELRGRFGMLFQGAALFDSMTILDNVAFPLVERPGLRMRRREAREKAGEVLARLRIPELGNKLPSEVSSGQRKRAALARAIVTGPEIVIYDEPTTGLDPVMTAYVNDMIVEAQETFRTTALVVSHDMASTFRISHVVAMLYHGRIVAFGTPAEVMRSQHPQVREFIYAGTTGGSGEGNGAGGPAAPN